jgi:acyl-CoA reductase-like NAD-dependent aldehyde dehydrogenase
MKPHEALATLRPESWAKTPIKERLRLLRQIQHNMMQYADELAAAEGNMKNTILGEDLYSRGFNLFGTVGPVGSVVAASIELYESLARGKMPEATEITQVNDEIYDVKVFPQTRKEKLMAGKQHGHLRLKGEPKQVSPMDKPTGVIAILGPGNYSCRPETVKALFWANKAVIHKSHSLNTPSDAAWQKVFAPLAEIGALAFCDAEHGRELTTLDGIIAIYFIGSTATAKAIMAATDTPLVAECGGNNPCIVVPGDRPWTEKELKHQAEKVVTVAKINGGAFCGRAQTLITSKQWKQRDAFLDAIRQAGVDTFASGTYYPGSDKVRESFLAEYPNAEVIQAKDGSSEATEMVLITDVGEDGFALKHEAFCQIISEVALDVEATAEAFLPAAVAFANERLLGTLSCMVLIGDETQAAHKKVFDQAITDLRYGGIAVNTNPMLGVFLNPYLTWGGNEEGEEIASGSSNFGNVLNFENVEKSILYDQFVSPSDVLLTNREATERLLVANTRYAVQPTWVNLVRLMAVAVMR